MEFIDQLFDKAPILALFITVALGYFVGKFKIGRFVLGGIAGTLIVGVLIGQLDIHIDRSLKTIFFALFIYAVGFQGGPQFFHALNRRTLNQLVSAFVMCFVGLLCVLVSAWAFDLDRGTAAGLAAGGLTQSAIIGTAGDAIAKLNVSAEAIKVMEANVAVGYAVCYIFGSLGPILLVTWFFPTMMKWDVRREAVKLAAKMSGGHPELEPGQFNAVRRIVTRIYQVSKESRAAGKTAIAIDKELCDAAVEAILPNGDTLDLADDVKVEAADIVAATVPIALTEKASTFFAP